MSAVLSVEPGAVEPALEPVCPCCGGAVSPLDLLFDERSGSIAHAGAIVRLSPARFRYMRVLFDAYPRVVSKSEMMDALYPDPDRAPDVKIVDVMACHVRKVIEPLGMTITTQWGVGYALELSSDSQAAALRSRRLVESRRRRLAFDAPDLPMIKVYRELGYPITDIARRLNLTFRAVMAGLDALEAAKVLPGLAARHGMK